MNQENSEKNFRLIQGGLLEDASGSKKRFVSAFVTNTRFMGVVVIGACWALTDNIEYTRLHQFFYIDAAENGIENYESILTGDMPDAHEEYNIRKVEISMAGGLGGTKKPLNEKELSFLLCSYAQQNTRTHAPLPEPESEYNFIFRNEAELSQGELSSLNEKLFVNISSPYEAINYFLMRAFEHDYEVAGRLAKGNVNPRLFPQLPPCILVRNTIERCGPSNGLNESNFYQISDDDDGFTTFDTRVSYLCKSVVDSTERHFLALTQITMEKYSVLSCTPMSLFALSDREASMINYTSEYITIFDFHGTSEDMEYFMDEYDKYTSVSDYPEGKLFMIFYPNNDHVKKSTYRLDDDVFGAVFVQDYSQIIFCSYSLENIAAMEERMRKTILGVLITSYKKYEFHQQVFGEYINSGMWDFEEFLKLISDEYDEYDDYDDEASDDPSSENDLERFSFEDSDHSKKGNVLLFNKNNPPKND